MTKEKNSIVIFNGARQHSFSAKKDCLVTLNAGSNVVSVEKINRLLGETGDEELDKMASESFVDMYASGEIEIIDQEAVVTAESGSKDKSTDIATGSSGDVIEIDIVKLGAKDAITVINSEASVEKIKAYLDAEISSGDDARKTVVKAAEEAINALEAPAQTDDED